MLVKTFNRVARLQTRSFAAAQLLVPLEKKAYPPAELEEGFSITNAYLTNLQIAHDKYNEKCVNDLKEMNQTKITNIIESGGIEGWDDSANLDALTRTFQFESFEQANSFIQSVGKFCEKKDHHPEWSSSNGGKSVKVRLTSHFAGNKLTLYDFELAENMNKAYKEASKFNMYSQWDVNRLITLGVVVGSAATFYLANKWLVANNKIMDYNMLQVATPMNQIQGESYENHRSFVDNTAMKSLSYSADR